MAIKFVDFEYMTLIYDTDANRRCSCGHVVWKTYMKDVCAWCAVIESRFSDERLGTAEQRELLLQEYRFCTEQDRIGIMAIVLGSNATD